MELRATSKASAPLARVRDGNRTAHEIEEAPAGGPNFGQDQGVALLAVDRTLTRLAARSERWCRIAGFRLFGGMSLEETAAAVGVSVAIAKRDWALARSWLYREMREDAG